MKVEELLRALTTPLGEEMEGPVIDQNTIIMCRAEDGTMHSVSSLELETNEEGVSTLWLGTEEF